MTKKDIGVKKKIIREETIQGILAVLFFAGGLTLIFSAFGKAGFMGEKLYRAARLFTGVGYFALPILCFFLTAGFLRARSGFFPLKKTIGACILFLCGLSIIDLIFPTQGGIVGKSIHTPIVHLFDVYITLVILAAIFIISLLIVFDASIPIERVETWWRNIRNKRRKEPAIIGLNTEEQYPEEIIAETEQEQRDEREISDSREKKIKEKPSQKNETPINKTTPRFRISAYTPPSLSILEVDRGKPGVGDIKANANIIKRTLQNFGIEVEMDEISIGPAVTRYALKPAESVRLSKIVALQRELELALAAHPIRIEAPIPGKSLVGIEIPNSVKATVGLATMLGSPEFASSDKPLLISLGKDLSGKAHFANLPKMPHLLIAGATGSGKSVTIHTIITSLLFRNGPDDLKFILIDPKRVELTLYNHIPHLLTPVITDAKKTILSLKWAAKEMERRYDILESESVRDIHSYHKNIVEPEYRKFNASAKTETAQEEETENKLPERMPYIIIVIDELADIMSTYPRELEAAIIRLAQMSRAVGIHLILSTQRPSVNIITGLIKANVPGRIALQVSSQIDSRTILDTGGAEKLLGAGDMLFLSGEMSKPVRLQSAFISETEVKKVTSYLSKIYSDEPPHELQLGGEENGNSIFENNATDEEEIDDDLYEEAREYVLHAGKASTSYLQRKLRIGYSRAARIMDMLEERNIIGPSDGSKPREVMGTSPAQTETENEITNN